MNINGEHRYKETALETNWERQVREENLPRVGKDLTSAEEMGTLAPTLLAGGLPQKSQKQATKCRKEEQSG